MSTRFGSVALIGAPNAGKSSLLNALLGTKISIVCHKSQTTRCRIAGIHTKDNSQLVLLDTPGIFISPKSKLEKSMIDAAWQAAFESNVILFIVDASRDSFKEEIDLILKRIQYFSQKAILVLNKIDLVADKRKLLEQAKKYDEKKIFDQIFMISATKKDGLSSLEKFLLQQIPEAPWRYESDQLANVSERFIVAELTREAIMHYLHEEVPYGIMVETDMWEEFKNKSVKIIQTVVVERKGHKSIVLGKGGQQIKKIGEYARQQISHFLGGIPVHLMLHVRVDEQWKDRAVSRPL